MLLPGRQRTWRSGIPGHELQQQYEVEEGAKDPLGARHIDIDGVLGDRELPDRSELKNQESKSGWSFRRCGSRPEEVADAAVYEVWLGNP